MKQEHFDSRAARSTPGTGRAGGSDGTNVTLDTTKVITDDYVRLLKGIAGYKAGANVPWLRKCSLPDLLASFPGGHCKPGRASLGDYALGALHGGLNGEVNKLSLPYREYIWKGGTYPTTNPDGSKNTNPNAGEDWCFAYGEKEWLAGKKWSDVKVLAIGSPSKPPVGRLECN